MDSVKIYVVVFIGPPKCGKTLFAQQVAKWFGENVRDFHVDIISRDITLLGAYLHNIVHGNTPQKRLLIFDKNYYQLADRVHVAQCCARYGAVYVQAFIEFDLDEIFLKNKQHIINNSFSISKFLSMLRKCLTPQVKQRWEINTTTISRSFLEDQNYEQARCLYRFLLSCYVEVQQVEYRVAGSKFPHAKFGGESAQVKRAPFVYVAAPSTSRSTTVPSTISNPLIL